MAGRPPMTKFETGETFARVMDEKDPLKGFRSRFHLPKAPQGGDALYFAGNSLGLQPKKAREYVDEELESWARLGVEGHFEGKHPWLPYHENVTEASARVVGAKPSEVVVMNTLTVNLHLMMVSFYRPTKERHKILIEKNAFPSDQYAVASQARFHGYDPNEAVLECGHEEALEVIEREGKKIALVMLGNVNYLTGYAFDMAAIAKAAHAKGCAVGFNLAHGAGNLLMKLHDWDVDFAVWCSYKYMNSGPGGLAGCFVHERHARAFDLPRFAGWWGHDKKTRFQMGPEFKPIPGAEGWQLSNPPILQLASIRASLELFDEATMPALRKKSELLTGYLEFLLDKELGDRCVIGTPRDPAHRGAQLSLKVKGDGRKISKTLAGRGVHCDFREPDVIRVAPAPLYNSFTDVQRLVGVLGEALA
jgi:kynureninase